MLGAIGTRADGASGQSLDPQKLVLRLQDFPRFSELNYESPALMSGANDGFVRIFFNGDLPPTRIDSLAGIYVNEPAARAGLASYSALVERKELFSWATSTRFKYNEVVHRPARLPGPKQLGTGARLYHAGIFSGRLREYDVYVVIWRRGIVDAVVTGLEEPGNPDPAAVVSFAVKQDRHIQAALARR
jgi:hypothetical protein